MVLSESENLGYGSTAKQEPPPQILEPDQEDQSLNKDLQLSPLGGQNSLMSLTLNEIQLKSGKNFGSMNMDEFLATLWTNVDDNNNQLIPTAQPPNQTTEASVAAATTTDNEPPTLARQGSFSIPAPLCKKTVDEVWYEIQKDQPQQQQAQNSNNNIGVHGHPLKQPTFGEMTLEDFLVKAGVVQEAPPSSGQHHSNNNSSILTSYQNPNSCLDSSFGLGQLMGLGLPSPHNVGNNSFSFYHHMFPNKGYNVGEATSNAEAKNGHKGQEDLNDMNAQQNKNKRIIDGPLEVVVERRQRRMIKNRESAARSRARKQAYTVELELELNQLKEENAKLKLIVDEIERKRKEEVMKRKAPTILTQKKVDRLRAIRRTVSLAW